MKNTIFKYLILFIFLISFVIESDAQTLSVQDSIIKTYNAKLSKVQTNIEKAILHFSLIKLYHSSNDTINKENQIEKLYLLSEQNDHDILKRIYNLSSIYNKEIKGDFSRLDSIYEVNIDDDFNVKDSLFMASIYTDWGGVLEKLGNYKKSKLIINKVSDFIKNADTRDKANVLATALCSKSALQRMDGDNEEAMKTIDKSILLLDKFGIKNKVSQEINKANLLYSIGKIPESYEMFLRVAKYTKENEMFINAVIAYMNASFVSKNLNDIEASLIHNREALEISQKINHLTFMAQSYLNISSNCFDLNDLNCALDNSTKALVITKTLDNISMLVWNYYSIGSVYAQLNTQDSSLYYLNKCLDIIEKEKTIDLKFYENRVHLALGTIEEERQNYPKAIHHYNHYIDLSKDKPDLKTRSKAFKYLSFCLSQLGRYRQAYEYLNQYQILKDSIHSVDNIRQAAEIKKDAQFEIEKEIIALQNENEKAVIKNQKDRVALAGIGIGILTLLSFIFIYILRKKNYKIATQNELLLQLNSTKDTLFQIIGHDLKKPTIGFRNVSKNINYLLDREDYDRLKALGQEVDHDAKSLYNLTDNLLNWALMQKDAINIKSQDVCINDLVNENIKMFKSIAEKKKIKLQTSIDPSLLVRADKNSLDTVIRNLLDNAIKYTDFGGNIDISTKTVEGLVQLFIVDDGIGFDTETLMEMEKEEVLISKRGTSDEIGSGLGLHLVKKLLIKNNGDIHVSNNPKKGAIIKITLPKAS